jgi:hypothetical protein
MTPAGDDHSEYTPVPKELAVIPLRYSPERPLQSVVVRCPSTVGLRVGRGLPTEWSKRVYKSFARPNHTDVISQRTHQQLASTALPIT